MLAFEPKPDEYVALARAVDESASDALLDERERALRDQIREVVAAELVPRAAETDRTHSFAIEGFTALAERGLVGLIFPKRWGGTEDSNVAYAAAVEEITAGCPATSLIYVTQMHAGYPIWRAASETVATRYLPGIIDGSIFGSLGITEPDAGSDAASLRTRATATDDGGRQSYVLSGSKTFITTGDRADAIVCFATVDPALGRRGITAFLVDGTAEGLTRGRPFDKMGMHGSSTAELFLSGVEVPAENRLGDEGDGWSLLMTSVIKSRISAAAQGVGIARAAYQMALHALRAIHGSKLPDEVTFALAEMRGEILRGRLLLFAVAREVDRSASPSAGEIAMMKQSCTDLGWRVSVEAARILGPFGDVAGLGVERCIRDSKVTQIYDGTNEVQRLLIGRDTTRGLEGVL
ncbi:acyl-CoA dehydrogenase family protein [Rhodococcus opacus]|nr:acyl-CoA dehydrogenase family protein [Rhodococcus opacus]